MCAGQRTGVAGPDRELPRPEQRPGILRRHGATPLSGRGDVRRPTREGHRMRALVPFWVVLLIPTVPASAATIKVKAGQSIQTAIGLANPGDKVIVYPGTYHEVGSPCPTDATHTCSVVVTKDDIRLIAQSSKKKPVILENPGTHDQGIAVAKSGAAGPACLTDMTQRIGGAHVQGFTVNGFGGEGSTSSASTTGGSRGTRPTTTGSTASSRLTVAPERSPRIPRPAPMTPASTSGSRTMSASITTSPPAT